MKKDTSGIPDVDLAPVKADLEAQAEEDEKGLDLGQFKTAEDLLKSYKEIQGAFTKVSQENKTLQEQSAATEQLKGELEALRQQQEMVSYQAPVQGQTQKSFDESWMESPEQTIAQTVNEQVNLARINDVLEAEDAANPAEFQERYSWADMLAKNPQYAPLAKTPAGVRRLFVEADKRRAEQLKANSSKSLEHIFGGPLDEEQLARLKTTVMGETKDKQTNNDAYMPDGSTSTKSGSDASQNQDNSEAITKAINKGDVDGVLDEMFKDISA